jgi:hypothetical protein
MNGPYTMKLIEMTPELLNAYNLLFPVAGSRVASVLRRLELDELKKAFRKKALEAHPDRAGLLGRSRDELTEEFLEIRSAYGLLQEFLEEREDAPEHIFAGRADAGPGRQGFYSSDRFSPNAGKANGPGCFDRFRFPHTELLFGQFLFYQGVISFKTLYDAIHWQRQQRPAFGKIAVDWRILSQEQVFDIIRKRNFRERMGEYALRKGLINRFQLIAILGKQRQMQNPLGGYFIENEILTKQELDELLEEHRRYNRQFEQ